MIFGKMEVDCKQHSAFLLIALCSRDSDVELLAVCQMVRGSPNKIERVPRMIPSGNLT